MDSSIFTALYSTFSAGRFPHRICRACKYGAENAVGFQGVDTVTRHKGVGSIFLPVAGGETYKLGKIEVKSADGADAPFDPDSEFIQLLDPADTHVSACYTYLSNEYCDWYASEIDGDIAEELREYVGWWDYTFGHTIDNILDGKCTNRDNEDIPVGRAFLCAIGNDAGRSFISSGEVAIEQTQIDIKSRHDYWLSYLPTAKLLKNFTIESEEDEAPFDPDSEFIQVLSPDDTRVTGIYTYLSDQYCDWYAGEIDGDIADILREYIGWWDYTFGKTIDNILEETAISRDNETVNPGDAFLCAFGIDAPRKVNVPGAL